MTIKAKLLATLTMICVAVIAMGLISFTSLETMSAKIKTIIEDRVACIPQLKDTKDAYDDTMDTTNRLTHGMINWATASAEIDEAIKKRDTQWKAYTATYLTDEEKQLVAEANKTMVANEQSVTEMKQIIARQDLNALNTFISTKQFKMMEETQVPLEKLIALQVRVAQEEYAKAQDAHNWALTLTAISALIVLGAVAASLYVSLKGVIAPINGINGAMNTMAGGNLNIQVPFLARKDEIGKMAGSLEIFRKGLVDGEAAREAAKLLDEKNLEQVKRRIAIVETFQKKMVDQAAAFAQSSSEVSVAAQSLASTAEETARQTQVVTGAAEEAAANVQTVAAATEEMAASVREINNQVSNSARVANEAASLVASTEREIHQLSASATSIGEVVNLINNIASQTNLLALNATIEAARAGDAGKGFAVVASEVKALATQTAKATDEISSKISDIQNATQHTVGAIEKIVSTINEIQSISSAISASVEQQGAATSEIAGNTSRAADGASQVTENIFGVGQAAEMTGAASTQLMSLSQGLENQAAILKKDVQQFVEEVNAA